MIQNTGIRPANIRSPIDTPLIVWPAISPAAACAAKA